MAYRNLTYQTWDPKMSRWDRDLLPQIIEVASETQDPVFATRGSFNYFIYLHFIL